jgi:hypothetical protein
MKCGVVIFPGSNCDEDMVHVLGTILGRKVERLWHKEHDLKGCELIVLPGGFSYGTTCVPAPSPGSHRSCRRWPPMRKREGLSSAYAMASKCFARPVVARGPAPQ